MTGIRKGILLAGGAGTRLYPSTLVASKQLQTVYDKPMVYYPLATLMQAGVRDILVISTPQDTPRFRSLLGSGAPWGIQISYAIQPEPGGIAQALLIGEAFTGGEPVCLVLGDNIFHGQMNLSSLCARFSGGAHVFAYPVDDARRYGVVTFDEQGTAVAIDEKPETPRSRYAVAGLYLYDENAVDIARQLRPSARGELEITDVNRAYLERGELTVERLGRDVAWLDTGTHRSLLEASQFIGLLEARQGLKIACLEEIAVRSGYVSPDRMTTHLEALPRCEYRTYVERVLEEVSGTELVEP